MQPPDLCVCAETLYLLAVVSLVCVGPRVVGGADVVEKQKEKRRKKEPMLSLVLCDD